MDSTLEELGKRAVACKDWKWMPGMLDLEGKRVLSTEHSDISKGLIITGKPGDFSAVWDYASTPDFSDPATLGCLLNLVREALFYPGYRPHYLDMGSEEAWVKEYPRKMRQTLYESEADVLVTMLEMAP